MKAEDVEEAREDAVEARKIVTFAEDTLSEAGQAAELLLRKVAVVAVVKNPFAGRYVQDLASLTKASEELGRRIVAIGVAAMGGMAVQSYGKAGLVGMAGEQEHAVAMLTTVYGNVMREGVGGGKAWISSMTKRVAPGESVDIPLAHKDALYVRSHYDGITLTLHDAPLPDEIAIIAAFANRGRINHRVGGLAAGEIKGEDGLV
jgi:amino acid synthesis protein